MPEWRAKYLDYKVSNHHFPIGLETIFTHILPDWKEEGQSCSPRTTTCHPDTQDSGAAASCQPLLICFLPIAHWEPIPLRRLSRRNVMESSGIRNNTIEDCKASIAAWQDTFRLLERNGQLCGCWRVSYNLQWLIHSYWLRKTITMGRYGEFEFAVGQRCGHQLWQYYSLAAFAVRDCRTTNARTA